MPCPNCAGTLDAVSLPFTPPWVCEVCHLGWWNAELAAAAVAAWRPLFHDFGASTATVMAAVAAEQAGT